MPKYEYSCITCDITIEHERSIHDEEHRYPCPSCGYSLTRVYTPFGLQFKGNGFYKTGG